MSNDHEELEFRLPAASADAAVTALLAARYRVEEGPDRASVGVFLDAFDWGIYEAGAYLEWRRDDNGAVLAWVDMAGDGTATNRPMDGPMDAAPAFAVDLPSGPLRERVSAAVGIRRLLPMMVIRRQTRTLELTRPEGGATAGLEWTRLRFEDPGSGAEGRLPDRVRLLPRPEGAGKMAGDVTEALVSAGAVADPEPALFEALTACGRAPGDYSSRIDVQMGPAERADRVTKRILRHLLGTLEANIPGARENLDPEFLHDLRVAVRRTRSALSQIREVLPPDAVTRFRERFAWLQQVTGPMRDLDVYLLEFPGYQLAVPEPLRPHLEPLRSYVIAHYDEEHRRLRSELESVAFRELLQDWHAFLAAADGDPPAAADAGRPIQELADARIWRLFKRVRREGQAIRPDSPPGDLHELRKSCKKLRYLIEFFQSLYPEAETRRLVRLMKALLDNLGEFQDLSVQAAHMRDLAVRMHGEGQASADTLLAMGALIGHLIDRQSRARAAFDATFEGFLARDAQDRFRALCGRHRRDKG